MVRHAALAPFVFITVIGLSAGLAAGLSIEAHAAPGAAGAGARPAARAPARLPAKPPAEVPRPPPPPPAMGAHKTVQRLVAPLGCDKLTIAEGLPNSTVRAIAQDARGFVWLGTQDGLVRYDGTRVRVYRPVEADSTSISSGYITGITVDPSGKLWVGTAEDGVNLYDPETDKFTRFARGTGNASITSEGVTSIARDGKDRVWLAMSTGGLNRYEPSSNSFTKFLTKPLDVAVTAIAAEASGSLWLGTAGDGVLRWNPETNAVEKPMPTDDVGLGAAPVNAILVASTGTVWIGTDGEGVLRYDPKAKQFSRYRSTADDPATISDDHVSSLFEDRSKNLWIGTTNGLNRLEPSGRLVRFQHDRENPTSLAFHGVESIYQDAGGVMWVGGFTVGVCRFDEFRVRFGHYYTADLTTSFYEDPDGTLWVGTYNDGLHKYERAAQRVTTYHELRHGTGAEDNITLRTGTWISAMHRDRRGTLWFSLRGRGLVGFDTKAETYKFYAPDPKNANSLPSDSVFDIWEDGSGKLWLATWGAGLVRFDPQLEVFTAYTADTGDATSLSSNHVYTIHPDPTDQGVLWLGTAKGGLVRFNTTAGTATSFRHKDDDPTSLSHDDVMSVYREPSGSVWVGTYGGGLNRLDPATGKAERFTTTNSKLTNNTIYGVLPDEAGALWLATNGGGLVQFDPKKREFFVYDSSDGVQDNEFNQGSSMRSKAGELFFGGSSGFNAFFPKEIKRDTYVPPVAVTTFKVFNQEVKLGQPIWTLPSLEVSYSDSFEIQFAALAFAAPAKNRYAYKLEGFDDDFIETDRPYATYTKLDGGNYTLRVRAANRHGVWNETGIALKLSATPPLWRTWPAYFGYLLGILGIAFLIYRIQRQRVQRAEREGRLAVVERDLELTGVVQTGFLPDENEINTPSVQVYSLYRPADACGGDWWWHESLSGGRRLIMVGDVTGHGPGPAMVTAAVATAFRVLMENGLDDVREGLELLNREVLRVAKGKYHMTMAALELDEASGRWIFHSAGAPPILSLNANGKHRVHFCPGAPLGTETGFETGLVEGQLEPTDRILLYTDGIPEIELPNGAAFGMRRFAQLYEHTRSQGLRDAAATILAHADTSLAGRPQLDDWTFALIEWTA